MIQRSRLLFSMSLVAIPCTMSLIAVPAACLKSLEGYFGLISETKR